MKKQKRKIKQNFFILQRNIGLISDSSLVMITEERGAIGFLVAPRLMELYAVEFGWRTSNGDARLLCSAGAPTGSFAALRCSTGSLIVPLVLLVLLAAQLTTCKCCPKGSLELAAY